MAPPWAPSPHPTPHVQNPPAGITLPYPNSKFAAEFTFVWLYLLVEPMRLLLGAGAWGPLAA